MAVVQPPANLTAPDRPCWLSITQAAELLAARRLSPVELTRSVLERIEETDQRVQAYVTVLAESALHAAREAEAAISRGDYRGPLHGIPVALKDLYYTAGTPTGAGSHVLDGFVPDHDAAVTERLHDAGAILVGKTVTHEFAYGQNTPVTRNPWDLDRTPGGSSAGSGAAVAAGSCLAAMGTDTGGSIRMPAAVDGIVGLKPTYGRVSRYGVVPLSWSLDHCGPLTRTVEDAGLVLQAIAGYDARDPASATAPVTDLTSGMHAGIQGLRLGVPRNYFFDRIHHTVREAFEQAVTVLEELGAVRVEVTLPGVELALPIGIGILMPEASSIHQRWLRESPERYDEGTRRMLEAGELQLATHYLQAQRGRAALKDAFKTAFREHALDALITPTEPTTATRIDQTMVDFGEAGQEPFFSVFVRHTIPFNLAGLPALSVPCGFSADTEGGRIGAGLPIGLHIAGSPFDEATILRIGSAYQSATDWHSRRPALLLTGVTHSLQRRSTMSIQEEQIADLVGKFKSGRISRRELMRGVSLFGGLTVTAGAIPALLAACSPAAPAAPAATAASGGAAAPTAASAPAPTTAAAAAAKVAPTASGPRKGGTLTAATIDKPVNMDPAFGELYSSIQVYDNIFAKLVYVTANNQFVPGLAKSWKQLNDTTWQFDLVDNAFFHNGEKFTGADVKYTFARLADKTLAAANSIFFTPLEGVEVVNDTQVRITTKANWGGLIGALAAFGEIVNEKGISANDPKLKPIGAGPYKLTEWVKDDHITLDRWEKYYKADKPYFDKVIFKAIADDTVRLTGLQKGELNWIEQVPLQKATDLTKSTDIKANPTGAYFPDLFLINCTKPPFDKLEVRQALAWALDRQAIVNLVWYGQAKPSAECLSPDNPMYSAQDPFKGAPNPQKAKDLLASAGVQLPLKVVFAAQPQVPTQVQVGQLIQQQLKPVGFDVQVQSFESAQWFEQLATKKYDFTSTYWSATLDPEHCVYPLGYSSSPWNFAGIKDDKLDAALDKFRYTVDPTERKKAYADVVTQMSQSAPMVFQVNFLRTYWTQPSITGVATLPSLELRMEDAWGA